MIRWDCYIRHGIRTFRSDGHLDYRNFVNLLYNKSVPIRRVLDLKHDVVATGTSFSRLEPA
jgi:hypothetical protein